MPLEVARNFRDHICHESRRISLIFHYGADQCEKVMMAAALQALKTRAAVVSKLSWHSTKDVLSSNVEII